MSWGSLQFLYKNCVLAVQCTRILPSFRSFHLVVLGIKRPDSNYCIAVWIHTYAGKRQQSVFCLAMKHIAHSFLLMSLLMYIHLSSSQIWVILECYLQVLVWKSAATGDWSHNHCLIMLIISHWPLAWNCWHFQRVDMSYMMKYNLRSTCRADLVHKLTLHVTAKIKLLTIWIYIRQQHKEP